MCPPQISRGRCPPGCRCRGACLRPDRVRATSPSGTTVATRLPGSARSRRSPDASSVSTARVGDVAPVGGRQRSRTAHHDRPGRPHPNPRQPARAGGAGRRAPSTACPRRRPGSARPRPASRPVPWRRPPAVPSYGVASWATRTDRGTSGVPSGLAHTTTSVAAAWTAAMARSRIDRRRSAPRACPRRIGRSGHRPGRWHPSARSGDAERSSSLTSPPRSGAGARGPGTWPAGVRRRIARRSRSSRMAMTYLRLVPVASRNAAGVSGSRAARREGRGREVVVRRHARRPGPVRGRRSGPSARGRGRRRVGTRRRGPRRTSVGGAGTARAASSRSIASASAGSGASAGRAPGRRTTVAVADQARRRRPRRSTTSAAAAAASARCQRDEPSEARGGRRHGPPPAAPSRPRSSTAARPPRPPAARTSGARSTRSAVASAPCRSSRAAASSGSRARAPRRAPPSGGAARCRAPVGSSMHLPTDRSATRSAGGRTGRRAARRSDARGGRSRHPRQRVASAPPDDGIDGIRPEVESPARPVRRVDPEGRRAADPSRRPRRRPSGPSPRCRSPVAAPARFSATRPPSATRSTAAAVDLELADPDVAARPARAAGGRPRASGPPRSVPVTTSAAARTVKARSMASAGRSSQSATTRAASARERRPHRRRCPRRDAGRGHDRDRRPPTSARTVVDDRVDPLRGRRRRPWSRRRGPAVDPSASSSARCSSVWARGPSSAATTSIAASISPAPTSMLPTRRSWPGHVDEVDDGPVVEGQVGIADVDRHPAPALLGQPVGVDAGQGPQQRRLAVVDVPGRADDDGHRPARRARRRPRAAERVVPGRVDGPQVEDDPSVLDPADDDRVARRAAAPRSRVADAPGHAADADRRAASRPAASPRRRSSARPRPSRAPPRRWPRARRPAPARSATGVAIIRQTGMSRRRPAGAVQPERQRRPPPS